MGGVGEKKNSYSMRSPLSRSINGEPAGEKFSKALSYPQTELVESSFWYLYTYDGSISFCFDKIPRKQTSSTDFRSFDSQERHQKSFQ